jgi:restriction endonuclease Mrr
VVALNWVRFVDLAAVVFRRFEGYEVIQTVRSGDGGADLLILSEDGRNISSIVECKKYGPERRIGVAYLRQLVGACVDWDTRRATLLTTSTFTKGARELQGRYESRGFELSLADGGELLKLLGCYNRSLPPLDALSRSDVDALIERNSRVLEYTLVVPTESMVHEREDGGYELVMMHGKGTHSD